MKVLRTTLLALVAITAACGGKSKPAAAPEEAPPGEEASCCCDYIKEEGDPAGDTWSENQTYEMMTPSGCAELTGECTDASQCTASTEEAED